jgi:hypothetical protein
MGSSRAVDVGMTTENHKHMYWGLLKDCTSFEISIYLFIYYYNI